MLAFQPRQADIDLSSDEDVQMLLKRIAKIAQAEAIAVYCGLTTPSITAAYGPVQFPGGASLEDLEALNEVRLCLDPKRYSLIRSRFKEGILFLVVESGRERTAETESAIEILQSVFQMHTRAQRTLALSAALSARHVERRERELLVLSQKIHNELSQNVTLIRLGLASVVRQLQESQGRVKADLEELIETAKQVSDSVIEISNNLRPPMVEAIGPVLALRQEVKRLQASHNVPVVCDLQELPMKGASALAAFRIAQECLSNIARHSQSTEVHLSLTGDGSSITLSIGDNGVGFCMEQNAEGVGLAAMREQAALAGGILKINTSPGRGTRVIAHFPAHTEAETRGDQ